MAPQKFKLGRDSLSYLLVKYSNNAKSTKRFSIDSLQKGPEYGIQRLERIFLKNKHFDFAVMYDAKTNTIRWYYHPKTGLSRLTKKQYYETLDPGSLKIYLIYNSAYRRRTGQVKGTALKIDELNEIHQYWNEDIERIQIYKNGSLIQHYIKGQFFSVEEMI